MKKNERLVVICKCGYPVSSEPAERGQVIYQAGACWKCKARFKYDVSSKQKPWKFQVLA